MTSIAIHFRASSKVGRHEGHLFFRLIHHRRVKTLRTKYRLFPEEWNKVQQSLIFSGEENDCRQHLLEMDESLRLDVARLRGIIKNKEEAGYYSVNEIVDKYQVNKNSNHLLEFTDKLSAKLIANKQERTARAYQTVTNGLVRFCKHKDLGLDQLNASLLKDYENRMKKDNKSPNTISFYMRNLRAIYNKAVQENRIARKLESPFSQVYTGVKPSRKRALSREELSALAALDLELAVGEAVSNRGCEQAKNLSQSHKLFLFCFYARGMSFVDMAYLKKENIKNGTLSYYRKKTGQLIEIKMTKYMQGIIRHFENEVRYSPYIFPIIKSPNKSQRLQYESGLRTQNQRLKKLAKLAKLEHALSTHVARHTWATLAKQAHLPLGVICEALGHSNEKTTYTYLASFERSVLDNANEKITRGIYQKQVISSCFV